MVKGSDVIRDLNVATEGYELPSNSLEAYLESKWTKEDGKYDWEREGISDDARDVLMLAALEDWYDTVVRPTIQNMVGSTMPGIPTGKTGEMVIPMIYCGDAILEWEVLYDPHEEEV